MDSNSRIGAGTLLSILLGVLFIGLKLGGIIDWVWCLVLLPLYWPLLVLVGVLILVAVCAVCSGIIFLIEHILNRKK